MLGNEGSSARSRWARRALAVVVAFDLVAGLGVLALHASDSASAYDTVDAVEGYRREAATTATTEAAAPAATTTEGTSTVATVDGDGATTTSSTTAPAPPAGDRPAPTSTTAPPAAAAQTTPSPVPPYPAEGVYVYETAGYEKVDAFGGSRHTYPDETTITVVHDGCGFRDRWQPLDNRVDVRVVCGDAGRHVARTFHQEHEFYGQRDERTLECEPGATVFRPDAQAGDTSRFRCTDPRTDSWTDLEVIGRERLDIGGVPVDAIHVRATTDVTGETTAHSVFDEWVHPENGLVLKRVSSLDGTSPGPTGDVRYHEEYSLVLRSLEPLR